MRKALFEDRKPLLYNHLSFWCPYCNKTWARGGNGEGFRKAGAQRHVFSCFEKSVTQRGLSLGNYSNRHKGYRLVKVARSVPAG